MNKYIKRIIECLLVFISVGIIYFVIECIFKQRMSHWSMFLLSGFGGVCCMVLNDLYDYKMDFILQVLICTSVIITGEYLVGITLNSSYDIWDYRNQYGNINGQICPLFSFIWAILIAILIPILDCVEWKVFKYKVNTPPYYKIFGRLIFTMR